MYCVTVDLSAINYTKGKMSYLNLNEKFICFESVYVLGRCGLNLSMSQFANVSSAVLLACSNRDEKRLRMRPLTQFSSAWSELFVRFIVFSVGCFRATLYGKIPALRYLWKS